MAHCENGDVIEVLIPEALSAGTLSPNITRSPAPRGARGGDPAHAAMSRRRCAGVYRPHECGREVDMLSTRADRYSK